MAPRVHELCSGSGLTLRCSLPTGSDGSGSDNSSSSCPSSLSQESEISEQMSEEDSMDEYTDPGSDPDSGSESGAHGIAPAPCAEVANKVRKPRGRRRSRKENGADSEPQQPGTYADYETTSDGKRVSLRRVNALTINACAETIRLKGGGCKKDPVCLHQLSPLDIQKLRERFGLANEAKR